MPLIKPISNLRNKANEILDLAHKSDGAVVTPPILKVKFLRWDDRLRRDRLHHCDQAPIRSPACAGIHSLSATSHIAGEAIFPSYSFDLLHFANLPLF
jgi:hypothetical protein